MKLKNNLREIRMREYMMNPGEFAKMLKVPNTTYSNWESEVSKPPLDKAIIIASKLNKKIEEIWYLE